MRFAITAIARGGGQAKSETVSDFVRRCKSGVYYMTHWGSGLDQLPA
jgi:hypothetical protein